MFAQLKNHPFAVEAFFESSVVLTFALPKEQLEKLIPQHLTLDTFDDKWAFIAVAMVQTKSLRPKGFPSFMGNDFFLIGYRVFVRHTNLDGKKLRGLYILKSETDKRKMEFLGNIFTHYSYTTTDINIRLSNAVKTIYSDKSHLRVAYDENALDVSLPEESPFSDWKEARRFAGPLPFTFTYNPQNNSMLVIEGVRQNWQPTPLNVLEYEVGFLKERGLENAVLANAFIIRNVPYQWKKGKVEYLS